MAHAFEAGAWQAHWKQIVKELLRVDSDRGERQLLDELARPSRPTVLAFVNAHAMNSAASSRSFFEALHAADVVLRDGSGMAILLKLLQLRPGLNLNGTDLIPKIFQRYAGRPIALFGTQEPYLARAIEVLSTTLARDSEFTAVNGFLSTPEYVRLAAERRPSLIVLGMGMPRQEEVARQLRGALEHPCLIVCGGAIIDFLGGRTPRAPRWMRAVGAEWLYRLALEPRRLFKRYVIGNPLFIARALKLAVDTPRVRRGGPPDARMKVLLTGGAGYIGSHTCVALVEAGFTPVILDNFANSHPEVLARLEAITHTAVLCVRGDVLDTRLVERVLRRHRIAGVVHLAGAKAVGESVAQPLSYYRNNLGGAVSLMQAMEAAGCATLVFSSSATVYGDPPSVPIREDCARSHTNPYGHTKLVIEDMLASQLAAQPSWKVAVLRYFNPVGAHPTGLIGEDPCGPPNNLMPCIAQVAAGGRACLQVFGSDYPTPDGTGVRDYIHVCDLAEGHVAALRALLERDASFTVNLGTGRGHSVLEVVRAFEAASGRPVPYQVVPRRPGDVAQCYADPTLAQQILRWRASRTLAEMCADTWRWQSANPDGYRQGSWARGSRSVQ